MQVESAASGVKLMQGDCIEKMRELSANSVDSIVTDPPYGLGFMGKKWDALPPSLEVFEECLRVLKPGGHLLAFGGSRTYHRLAVAVEDAGFEIRDQIQWVYGSGFPKSQDVSKAIDKAAGAEREVVGFDVAKVAQQTAKVGTDSYGDFAGSSGAITAPATEAARRWEGWGTALKPAHEPIVMARKPLAGTVAANVMEYGTGAINVDGCRVDATEGRPKIQTASRESNNAYGDGLNGSKADGTTTQGRFPANLIHDGSDEVMGLFPVTTSGGGNKSRRQSTEHHNCYGTYAAPPSDVRAADTGSAARFFYCAKASKKDRGEGNRHPTVKPTELMCYLVRLVTPPGGVVLDPFMGSGSTGKAAMLEGFGFVGIELDPEYFAVAEKRVEGAYEDRAATRSTD